METKASLNAQLAAAQKKHGAKSQAAGRIQYKLNQLNKNSKGTAVKTKTGVLTSKTGVVRQKDASKKVRKPVVKKLTMDRNPNTVAKAATKVATKPKGKVTVTGLNGKSKKVKAGSADKVITPVQKKNDNGLEKQKPSRMVRKGKGHPSAEMFAYVQNIGKNPSVKVAAENKAAAKKAADKKAAAKKAADKKAADKKRQAAYRKSAASVISSRKTGNYSGL